MKRCLVGLLALGLILGLLIGCQLKAPSTSDQTQKSSSTLTVTEEGSFGEEKSFIRYFNNDDNSYDVVSDSDTGDDDPTDNDNQTDDRWTVTFDTDGNWEWILESYERNDDDDNGNGTKNEKWVKIAGEKGTYSYDPDTYQLTLTRTGKTWDTTNDKWTDAWDKNIEPADEESYSYTVPVVLSAQDLFNEQMAEDLAQSDLETVEDLFLGNPYLADGRYSNTKKRWDDSGSWSNKKFDVTIEHIVFDFDDENRMLTFWEEEYRKNADGSYDQLAPKTGPPAAGNGHDTYDKKIYTYTKTIDYDLHSGNEVTFSEVTDLYELDANDFDKGDYTWEKDKAGNRDVVEFAFDFDDDDAAHEDPDDDFVEFDATFVSLPIPWEAIVDISGEGDYIVYVKN